MEKIKLNNQVVQMRKYVKQAKVHIINKLVKEVKLLQNRKGNEVKILKAKRKADRFLEEVALLKKIRPDDVSKLALLKAKDWKCVLQKKDSTLEDRCIALLANYEAVQKEVEAFHSSNKELVMKITDLIEQWEEKNKNVKDSVKFKNMSNEKKTENNIHKIVCKDKDFTSDMKIQPDTDVKINRESLKKVDNKKSTVINKKHETQKNNHWGRQNQKSSVKLIKNAASNELLGKELYGNNYDSGNDVENTSEVNKDPAENPPKINESSMETEESCSDNEEEVVENDDIENISTSSEVNEDPAENSSKINENSMESEVSDSDDEEKVVENDDVESALEVNEDPAENSPKINESSMETEVSDSDDEEKVVENDDVESASEVNEDPENLSKLNENSMEAEGSDSDNEEEMLKSDLTIKDIAENEEESKSFINKSQQSSVVSEFVKKTRKMDNSAENKLKEITLLNLDDLQGLDEIPVNNVIESDKSDEEMTKEETDDTTHNKRNDPFFLGCSGNEIAEKLVDSSKDDFISRYKNSFSSISRTSESPEFLQRQENSSWSSHNKKTKRFLNNPRRNSTKFRNDQDNFKSFKKGKFLSRNYQDKYQEKNKNTFNRDNVNNKKDFDMKCKMQPSREKSIYGRKKHDGNSNDLYHRNARNNFPIESKVPHKKDNTSNKPLHPSWEARKKQKELINTSFQGKRMVFGD